MMQVEHATLASAPDGEEVAQALAHLLAVHIHKACSQRAGQRQASGCARWLAGPGASSRQQGWGMQRLGIQQPACCSTSHQQLWMNTHHCAASTSQSHPARCCCCHCRRCHGHGHSCRGRLPPATAPARSHGGGTPGPCMSRRAHALGVQRDHPEGMQLNALVAAGVLLAVAATDPNLPSMQCQGAKTTLK